MHARCARDAREVSAEVSEIDSGMAPPSQVLLEVVRPYTRIRIPFISAELNISDAEVKSSSAPCMPALSDRPPLRLGVHVAQVEELLVSLILDGRISGHIDQMASLLLLNPTAEDAKKFDVMHRWSKQLGGLQQGVFAKLN